MEERNGAVDWAKNNDVHVKEYHNRKNGSYCNFCVYCGERFLGYKRDIYCGRKECNPKDPHK